MGRTVRLVANSALPQYKSFIFAYRDAHVVPAVPTYLVSLNVSASVCIQFKRELNLTIFNACLIWFLRNRAHNLIRS